MDKLRVVREIAAARHGVVSRAELSRAGLDRRAVHRAVVSGVLTRLSPRTFSVGGTPDTRGARSAAAVTDAGPSAHLGRVSALAWWRIPGFELEPIHVVRPHGEKRIHPAIGIVHRTRDYLPELVTTLDGVPVARPELALFQSAADIHPGRLARAVDNAWAMRLVDARSLRRVLALMKDRGRGGTAAFREVLESRPLDYRPPGSNLESRFTALLAEDGQEAMERQVDLGDEEWIGRVDFVDRERRLVVEVLSTRYHAALTDVEADRGRFERLRAAGWFVVGVWDDDIWTRGRDVAMVIRRLRGYLGGGLGPDSPLLTYGPDLTGRTPGGAPLFQPLLDTGCPPIRDAWLPEAGRGGPDPR